MTGWRWWSTLRARFRQLWRKAANRSDPHWETQWLNADILPDRLPIRTVVVAQDDGEAWSVGMTCPCGCGDAIELALFPEAEQRWRLSVDANGRPSLSPSVWRRTGCRSHFWVREGRVLWCR